MTASILTKCKCCQEDVVTKADKDCPQQWIDALLPMVACNRCMKMIDTKNKAVSGIETACKTLCKAQLLAPARDKHKPYGGADADLVEKLRRSLMASTQAYARAVADFHRVSEYFWMPDFVEQILDNPSRWWLTLRHYRRLVAQHFNTPSFNPEDKVLTQRTEALTA